MLRDVESTKRTAHHARLFNKNRLPRNALNFVRSLEYSQPPISLPPDPSIFHSLAHVHSSGQRICFGGRAAEPSWRKQNLSSTSSLKFSQVSTKDCEDGKVTFPCAVSPMCKVNLRYGCTKAQRSSSYFHTRCNQEGTITISRYQYLTNPTNRISFIRTSPVAETLLKQQDAGIEL